MDFEEIAGQCREYSDGLVKSYIARSSDRMHEYACREGIAPCRPCWRAPRAEEAVDAQKERSAECHSGRRAAHPETFASGTTIRLLVTLHAHWICS